MIWSTSNHQSTHSGLIRIISILAFWLVGGFFVSRFGVMPGTEWVSILMILGIAAISYRALVRDARMAWVVFLLLSGILALIFEYVGIHSCVPYGCFVYGSALGPKILDTVPWTVFVGWTPLIIGVYAILRTYIQRRWMIVVLWAILLTLADMVLDPGAVLLWFWSFAAGGWYYDVPWSNFAGWLVSGSVGILVATILLRKTKPTLAWTYSAALSLSFFTWVAVFSGMWLPALLWWLLLGGYFVYFWGIYNSYHPGSNIS